VQLLCWFFYLFTYLFLSIPLVHLDLNPGCYVQTELNRMVQDKQKKQNKTTKTGSHLLISGCPIITAWSPTPLELKNSSAVCG